MGILNKRIKRTNEKKLVKSFDNHLKWVAKKSKLIRAKREAFEIKAAKYEAIRMAKVEAIMMRNTTFKTGRITPISQSLQAA